MLSRLVGKRTDGAASTAKAWEPCENRVEITPASHAFAALVGAFPVPLGIRESMAHTSYANQHLFKPGVQFTTTASRRRAGCGRVGRQFFFAPRGARWQ